MLIKISEFAHRGISLKSILHVGANVGEEMSDYFAAGAESVLSIEARQSAFDEFVRRYGADERVRAVRAIVSDSKAEAVDIYVASNGESSSILKPTQHLMTEHPHILFGEIEQAPQTTLDDIVGSEKYEFLNVDVQGAELMVLQGGRQTLKSVRSIYIEVNVEEMYEGCPMLSELDEFLEGEGFVRCMLSMTTHGWGDALYVRPVVSVLLATHNGAATIKESIDSVLSQVYLPFEILVGLNGCTDGTMEAVKSYDDRRIRIFEYEEPNKSKTLNLLLRQARGEWIAIQDDDDLWTPKKLEKQLRLAGEVDVCGTSIEYFGSKKDVRPIDKIRHEDIVRDLRVGGNQIANSSAMIRKDKLVEAGGWRDYYGVEDYDLWMRLMKMGCRFGNVPEVLVKHRIGNSHFNANPKSRRQMNLLRKMHRVDGGCMVVLLVAATGEYLSAAKEMVKSASQYFLKGHHVEVIVFTNKPSEVDWADVVEQRPLPWPFATMMRYSMYLKASDRIREADYVFAIDADMRFVAPVGDEILGPGITAVHHPGFYKKDPSSFTFEKRRESKAFVQNANSYYAGGFIGGRSQDFLNLCQEICDSVMSDLSAGIVAIWHDESHLNRYLNDHPPAISLDPSYCYAESECQTLDGVDDEIRKRISGGLCFDVGANVGKKTKVFLDMGAKVVAVEPDKKCADVIAENPRLVVVNKALGETQGNAKMMLASESTLNTLSSEFIEIVGAERFKNYKWEKSIEVPVTTLEELVREFGVPGYCKIDVEGYEESVLKGAVNVKLPFLSFEFTPELKHNADACAAILGSDYKYNFSSGESGKFHFKKWKSWREVSLFLDSEDYFGDVYAVLEKPVVKLLALDKNHDAVRSKETLSVMVVSKDRPFFLEQLLLSLENVCFDLTVLYLATTPEFDLAFEKVKRRCWWAKWMKQPHRCSMRPYFLTWLKNASDMVMVCPDDNICTGSVNTDVIRQTMQKGDVFGFTLRLHPGITNTQATTDDYDVPDPGHGIVEYQPPPNRQASPWGYVWEMSSTFYRKADLQRIVDGTEFSTINDLETIGLGMYPAHAVGKMCCFRYAPITNIFVDTNFQGSMWCVDQRVTDEDSQGLFEQRRMVDIPRTFRERDARRVTHVKGLFLQPPRRLDNKAVVVIPARNCQTFVAECCESLVRQSYPDLGVVFVDDASGDHTAEVAEYELRNRDSIVIRGVRQRWAMRNIEWAIEEFCDTPKQVIFLVDGDDKLMTDDAIERMMEEHKSADVVWSQYQQSDNDMTCSGPLPPGPIRGKPWRMSHLRSFKRFLFLSIDKSEFKDEDGSYFKVTWDQAIMIPMGEMTPRNLCRFYPHRLYYYRIHNNNDHSTTVGRQEQWRAQTLIHSRPAASVLPLYAKDRTISVVVSCYNQAHVLPLFLEAMFFQTMCPMEVIVADDGSSDGVCEWIDENAHRYPFELRYVTRKHQGYRLASLENMGAAHARGSRILFTNADVIHNPDSIKEHLGVNGVGGGIVKGIATHKANVVTAETVRDYEQVVSLQKEAPSWRNNLGYMAQTNPQVNPIGVWGGNFSVPSDKFREVGGFDEGFTGWGGEDNDLVKRLAHAGCSVSWVNGSEVIHLDHETKQYSKVMSGSSRYISGKR